MTSGQSLEQAEILAMAQTLCCKRGCEYPDRCLAMHTKGEEATAAHAAASRVRGERGCHCGKDGHALGSINCPVHGDSGAERRLRSAKELCEIQACDEVIWAPSTTFREKYLQAQLRLLHETVEGKSWEDCAKDILSAASQQRTADNG